MAMPALSKISSKEERVQNHSRPCRSAHLSALERRQKKIQEMAAVRSSTALLTAFRSLLFQDAAPGKVSHESLMNSILFNTSNWATAPPSCVAPTKCHNPEGWRNSTARGRFAGSRGAHNLWSRVHHPTSYSVTETRGGCCNTDDGWASSDTCPAGCKAPPGSPANTAKSAALFPLAHIRLDSPPLLLFSLLYVLKIFTGCSSLPFASAFSCSAAFVPLFPLRKGIFSWNNCACITENTQNPHADTVLEAQATWSGLNILAQQTNEAQLYGPVITFSCSSGLRNPHVIFCRVLYSAFLETKRKRKQLKNAKTGLWGHIRHSWTFCYAFTRGQSNEQPILVTELIFEK